MTRKKNPIDFEAARADIDELIEANAAALAKVRDQLESTDPSEVDALADEQAHYQSKRAALEQARSGVDKREAAQAKADEARQRKADEAERERLMAVVKAASAKAADLVEKLATVTTEACDADRRAAVVGARLGNQQKRSLVQFDLATLILAKLPELAPNLRAGYAPPAASEAAAARLTAVS